jgi:NAD(P)-dependent dehydrogenase (short-subunit alcohol dehydrogenase family)
MIEEDGMRTVNGMNAVITGAGSGIGQELAIQLSRLGVAVIVTDIDKKGLDETCSIIKKTVVIAFPICLTFQTAKKYMHSRMKR